MNYGSTVRIVQLLSKYRGRASDSPQIRNRLGNGIPLLIPHSLHLLRQWVIERRYSLSHQPTYSVQPSYPIKLFGTEYRTIVRFITSASPPKEVVVFTSVCLSVCRSVRRITEKVVNGFWRNFLEGQGMAQGPMSSILVTIRITVTRDWNP